MSAWRLLFVVGLLVAVATSSSGVSAQVGTIIVNTTSDIEDFGGAKTVADLPGPDGLVSLREAVTAANNTTGPNTIAFNVPTTDPGFSMAGFSGQYVFFIEGIPLIVSDNDTTIDGRTQTAFTGDTAAGGEVHLRTNPPYANMSGLYLNSDNNLVVGLDGLSMFRYGILINGNSNTIIGNAIRALSAGVYIAGANNRVGGASPEDMNRILGATTGVWIYGSGATGNLIQGNIIWRSHTNGVSIDGGASGNTVGGANAGTGNFLFSNGHTSSEYFPVGADVSIRGNNNLVQGNFLGVDQDGVAAGGSVWSGVELSGQSNTIRENVISGHVGYYFKLTARPAGIRIIGGGNHVVQGNLIGTDPGGSQAMPNEYGIKIETWLYADVPHDNQIGGVGPGEANVIAFNIYDGITVDGDRNRISGNSILSNGELGINLAPNVYTQSYPNTVTPNDPGDLDEGPNNLQNFPVITSASEEGTSTVVRGTIDTQSPQQITIELFSSDSADPSGYGEGEFFQGTTVPDASGSWVATFAGGLGGKYVTATATDGVGNTSEFSQAVLVGGGSANTPPVAAASASPESGVAPLTVNFSSSGSFDPDGDPLSYSWVFGDVATSSLANPSHTYSQGGSFSAILTVTDSAGASSSDAVTISVGAPVSIRSSDIALSATLKNNTVTVLGKVTVQDYNGEVVAGANVKVKWTLPGGKATTQNATTNSSGVASFTMKGRRGTYTLTVQDITGAGYLFDPANSVLSASITK